MEKNEIQELLKKYDITSWGYKALDIQSLKPLQNRDIHKLTSDSGISIINQSITKNNCTLKIRECFIARNKINMRVKDGFFIRTFFSDVTFSNGSFQNYLFINCYFKDTVITTSNFSHCIFINSKFENVQTLDTELINCEFINTNISDVLNEFGISVSEQFHIKETNISYTEIFDTTNHIEENIKSEGEQNMNEDFIITDKTVKDLELGKQYQNCIFEDMDIISMNIHNDTEFYSCQFKNIKFISVNFINVLFDDSIFDNCTFSNCTFSRCSMINVSVTENNKFSSQFFKVNFYNAKILCIMDNSNFEGCSIPDIQKVKNTDIHTIKGITDRLDEIKAALNNEAFIDNIEKPKPEITHEDIFKFFKSLNLIQAMSLISSITQLISQVNSTPTTNTTNDQNII